MKRSENSSLRAIQQRFHDLIMRRAGYLVQRYGLTLPNLEEFAHSPNRKGLLPIPGMHGGFSYWLESEDEELQLIVLIHSRIVSGSEEFHAVSATGIRTIAGQERQKREHAWLHTGRPDLLKEPEPRLLSPDEIEKRAAFRDALWSAVERSDLAAVRAAASHALFRKAGLEEAIALIKAAGQSDFEVARCLIEHGVSANAVDSNVLEFQWETVAGVEFQVF